MGKYILQRKYYILRFTRSSFENDKVATYYLYTLTSSDVYIFVRICFLTLTFYFLNNNKISSYYFKISKINFFAVE